MDSIFDTLRGSDEPKTGIRSSPIGDMLKIDSLGDSFSIEYPILSLDALDEASFNFCSSIDELYFASQTRAPKKQTLLSQEAFNYLKWRGLSGNFLPCPYFRPISLGSLSVELFPSGEGCGSSFLHVQKGLQSAFYAHNWSSFESKALRSMVAKEAKVLILKLSQTPQNRSHITTRKELQRCCDLIQKVTQAKEWVILNTSSFGQTNVLLHELCKRQIPCYLDNRTYKMLMSMKVDSTPDELPKWLIHPKKLSSSMSNECPGVILLAKENLRTIKWLQLPDAIWFWVGDDLENHLAKGPNWLSGITFSEVFSISFRPDFSEILALVHQVKPEKVIVAGEGSDFVVSSLNRQGFHAASAVPKQLTLF